MIGLIPAERQRFMVSQCEYRAIVLAAGAGHNVAFCAVEGADTKYLAWLCAMARQEVMRRCGGDADTVVVEGREWNTGDRFDIKTLSGKTLLVPCLNDLCDDALKKVDNVGTHSHILNVDACIYLGLEGAEDGEKETQMVVGLDWNRHNESEDQRMFRESHVLTSIEIVQVSDPTTNKMSVDFATIVNESVRLRQLLLKNGVSTKWNRNLSLNREYKKLGVMERDAMARMTPMEEERTYLVAYDLALMNNDEINLSWIREANKFVEGCGIR